MVSVFQEEINVEDDGPVLPGGDRSVERLPAGERCGAPGDDARLEPGSAPGGPEGGAPPPAQDRDLPAHLRPDDGGSSSDGDLDAYEQVSTN